MIKILSIAAVAIALSAVIYHFTSTTSSSSVADNTRNLIVSGQTITLADSNIDAVNIVGSRNTINIDASISAFNVTGSDNTLNLGTGVSITACNVVGNRNTANVRQPGNILCNLIGKDNKGFSAKPDKL
ncbi:MAG: hypothetical protein OEZ10_04525 [Gammaproteobacteria bacterium]|nr:hypothetical protein [Gammaproteobacteria bacterium]